MRRVGNREAAVCVRVCGDGRYDIIRRVHGKEGRKRQTHTHTQSRESADKRPIVWPAGASGRKRGMIIFFAPRRRQRHR